jgi:glycosyltransferase involved in cell wall biosynthesis
LRLLILYASDLGDPSRIAPGGITSNVRGYAGLLPPEWSVEVWGAAEGGVVEPREIRLGARTVLWRSLLHAEPVTARSRSLNPRFAAAVARRAWMSPLRRQFDVVLAHRTEYLAALALTQPRRRLPILLQMIHGSSAWSRQSFTGMRERTFLLGERLAVRTATSVALVATSTLGYYQRCYPAYAHKFLCIPNGVDVARFALLDRDRIRLTWRTRLGLAPDDRALVYHGRYDEEKGVRRMLAVLRVLRSRDRRWKLRVAGSGPLASLFQESGAAQDGGCHDVGPLPADDIPGFLSAGDVGLLFSDFEGLSNGLLECLASGLPMAATPVGDTPYVLSTLDPSATPGFSEEGLAEAVVRAWATRDQWHDRARQRAAEFSLRRRAERITSLVETAAGSRAGRDAL